MIEKISKIYHIADIHIRNFKRHKEYQEVFSRLFTYINETKTNESVIYLAGDIVHSKTDMTPELVAITSKFLKSCADICPTILIPGNHDTNLSNQSRLDALSPIVESLNHPNLFYWKETGEYTLGNITFLVYSVFGSIKNWINPATINSNNVKIILHHGAVYGASTDLNYDINNESVKIDIFKGADLVLLGDIHKRQFLNPENTIHYPGSLIQQSHGESLDKGITVWDINTKTSEFIKIDNDYGYATIHMSYGKIMDDKQFLLSLPKKVRLRIKYEHTTKDQLQSAVSILKKKYHIEELSLSRIKELENFKSSSSPIENVRDIEYQNSLFTEYLEQSNILNVDIDSIRHINRTINSELNSNLKLIRNIKWKPIRMEFSNMFSYGPGNILDFSNMNGILGIFAQNATGKSSLLDIFTYCIYDKCSRAWKARDVLNNQKTKFKCKLDLELNDEVYTIERSGFKSDKTGNVRVEVDFYKIDSMGSKILLNGEDRDSTNKAIRDYLGTYDDFLLTTLSTQNDNKNFIFKTQKERKELLYSFLDLSVFEELQGIAKKIYKDKNDQLSVLESELQSLQFSGLTRQHESVSTQYNEQIFDLSMNQTKLMELQTTLDGLNSQLIPILEKHNWKQADEQRLIELKNNIDEENKKLEENYSYQVEFNNTYTKLSSELDTYSEEEITKQLSRRSDLNKAIYDISLKLDSLNKEKEFCEDLITKLKNHEYDPNCQYCINNQFVRDARSAAEHLPEIIKQLEHEQGLYDKLMDEYDETQQFEILNEDYKSLKLKIFNINQRLLELKDASVRIQNRILILNQEKTALELIQKAYYDNLQNIETNNKIHKQKEEVTKILNQYRIQSNTIQQEVNTLYAALEVLNAQIRRRDELNNIIPELRRSVNEYFAYIEATSIDGLPYLILQKILPVIENEVNVILQEIVDFSVRFESDEKSNINCYLLYSNENIWPVEMASGMERFIVSLAIRIALVEITSLPRPNFMAIDEGFGALDSEKISAMTSLFDYMRTKFNFIIAVSHVDTMRDMVDGLIDVHKNSHGFSEVIKR